MQKMEDSDVEIECRDRGNFHKNKKGRSLNKRSFYSKEDGSSSKDSDEHTSDDDKK